MQETMKMQTATKSYFRFAAMIATSMLVMLGLMYLNTYTFSHIQWSETRAYMTVLMGASMAIVMLAFMWNMYKRKGVNWGIVIGSLMAFSAALYLVRSQMSVQDDSWMKAMIPHHSIAILTSERAEISDVRVRDLADSIIEAQRREIKVMNWLLEDIEQNGEVTDDQTAQLRAVPEFDAQL